MCVVGTVFVRLTGTEIDEHQILHHEIPLFSGASVQILQHLRERFGLLAGLALDVAGSEDFISHVRERAQLLFLAFKINT